MLLQLGESAAGRSSGQELERDAAKIKAAVNAI
jgi:hypothetical protein